MQTLRRSRRNQHRAVVTLAVVFIVLPAVHPIFIPMLGPPSHLLWFAHVFPVALTGYLLGTGPMLGVLAGSVGWVAAGESIFGAGYGVPADSMTVWALTISVGFANLLVGSLAVWIRRIERDREHLDRFTAAALDASPDAMLLVDAEHRIRHANPEAIALLDADGAITGLAIERFVPAESDSLPMLGAESRSWLHVARTASGRQFAAEITLAPVRTQGAIGGWLVAIRDRSEALRRQAQEQRATTLRDLGSAMATVAHELNNPLTTVQVNAELLAAASIDSLPDDVREAIEALAHEGRRAGEIARRLLGRVRTDADGARQFALPAVIDQVLRTRSRQLIAHGVQVAVEMEDGLPQVHGHPGEMEQVLVNLLANAEYAVHRHRGGGKVRVRVRSAAAGAIELVMEDDGPGIPSDSLGRLFEPFYSTKGADGNGIGLALARRIAREWGGDLVAGKSELGGAAFTFVMRAALAAMPVAAAAIPSAERIGANGTRPVPVPVAGGSGLTVLLVDDDSLIQSTLTRYLERQGCAVRAADSAAEAIAALDEAPVDVIVTDLRLGGTSGVELSRLVAQRGPSAPGIVLMTGDPGNAAVVEFKSKGEGLVLAKPFAMHQMLDAIHSARAACGAGNGAVVSPTSR